MNTHHEYRRRTDRSITEMQDREQARPESSPAAAERSIVWVRPSELATTFTVPALRRGLDVQSELVTRAAYLRQRAPRGSSNNPLGRLPTRTGHPDGRRDHAVTDSFISSEDLRALLVRLQAAGRQAWRDDPAAAELMAFTMQKYAALARKHGLEPADAAVAAFEVMRTRAVRTAQDPWAVVTRAVQITLAAEERANGLLCSTSRARRNGGQAFHDAERFSERETPLYEYHPAFRVSADQDDVDVDPNEPPDGKTPTSAYHALDQAVWLLAALGWPHDTARTALEYICARLSGAGTRANAHEILRRDHHARALLDLDRRSWSTLLRIVLGSPNPDLAHTDAGRGLLLRILIDEQIGDLLADDDMVLAISSTAERVFGRSHA